MDSIINVINTCYSILQNRLTFGNYSFTLFAVVISFAVIPLAGWFFSKLFESR